MRAVRIIGAAFIAALLVFCVGARAVQASAVQTQSFPAVKTDHPPVPENLLADPGWQAALKADGFQNVTTHSAGALATTAYLMYGNDDLYVAFHCEQSTVAVTAEQTTNNVGFGLDDYVAVGIDPSGNGSQVYYFFATPRGVRYQQASESSRYQPAWDARGSIVPGGWNAVLIIPLKDIRAQAGRQWRFNFLRHVARVNENYSWAYNAIMTDNPGGGT